MKIAYSLLAVGLLFIGTHAHAYTEESDSDTTSQTTQAVDSDATPADSDDDSETSAAVTRPAVADEPAPRAQDLAPAPAPVPAPAPEQAARVTPPPPVTPAVGNSLQEARPEVAGDLRAPSPKIFDENRRGFFQLGVGPAYGAALVSDSLMYNVVGSYNLNTSDRWTLKGLVDLYMATGSVSSRQFNFGVGGEYYLPELSSSAGTPYAAADVAVGFARNAVDETATGLNLGAGAGFRFQVRELNCDLQAHYSQLTANVGASAPAIFALRGSVAF